MTLSFDPEAADVLAQLGGTDAFQPSRDDVEGRRTFREPILVASCAAQPFPESVRRVDLADRLLSEYGSTGGGASKWSRRPV
ncbi:hypothetical protein [Streptomyces rapamycinicus]|uniref:Uncharacterized protein n=2 Tax=Streptomyces rapamycinicus TaxID=1226757 RepID=A0A0A0N702_STRRN|nr:hypothetical protein [Streptomyces rapamycinicus]AGP52289.1 hypothetical protein M271_03295 [Streptomyces rapamycinicus NRRL 5491]MBB4779750.1 hypothetical protein [Streptomyces rapamycinicus]RLV75592.1 hypothetical protein D3C57_140240 [Streptomyces rapamycinicus NRRL 5491]UTP37609.1 hypothetical protein LIV37_03420 [Streptomyces rapamycinicus NRRL 5491]